MARRTAKKKALTVVSTESGESGGDENAPRTPAECVTQALELVKEAIAKVESSTYCLEDGRSFFDAFDPEFKVERIRSINEFLKKSHFALSAFRDEILISLGQQAKGQKVKLPELIVETPPAPKPVVLPEEVSLEDLKQTKSLFDMTLAMLADCDIKAFQAENAVQVIRFQTKMRDGVASHIAAVKGQ